MSRQDSKVTPVEPWELSGLLDGELAPQRATQVRAAIASDPSLRTEFEALARSDAQWTEEAAIACGVIRPKGFAASAGEWSWPVAALIAIGALAVRFVPKFIPPAPGVLLQGLVLAVLLVWAVRLVGDPGADDEHA